MPAVPIKLMSFADLSDLLPRDANTDDDSRPRKATKIQVSSYNELYAELPIPDLDNGSDTESGAESVATPPPPAHVPVPTSDASKVEERYSKTWRSRPSPALARIAAPSFEANQSIPAIAEEDANEASPARPIPAHYYRNIAGVETLTDRTLHRKALQEKAFEDAQENGEAERARCANVAAALEGIEEKLQDTKLALERRMKHLHEFGARYTPSATIDKLDLIFKVLRAEAKQNGKTGYESGNHMYAFLQ